MDKKATEKIGVRAVIYYIITTFIAVFIGIVLVINIKPGKGNGNTAMSTSGRAESVTAADAFLDLIRQGEAHVVCCLKIYGCKDSCFCFLTEICFLLI